MNRDHAEISPTARGGFVRSIRCRFLTPIVDSLASGTTLMLCLLSMAVRHLRQARQLVPDIWTGRPAVQYC